MMTVKKTQITLRKKIEEQGVTVRTGKFRALMEVSLINYGPVTLIVES